ncbi:uncharacterized protein PAC_02875 [Phialocephala subalpina]|uniref:Uncharacterized protein n=1 Tax=Phialocephala subalpina TaxID=576137 RepID=A0A1L7WJP8_9HELO|nr:uncharacterized protein PAC_02875 [Phialocephala subalpina]
MQVLTFVVASLAAIFAIAQSFGPTQTTTIPPSFSTSVSEDTTYANRRTINTAFIAALSSVSQEGAPKASSLESELSAYTATAYDHASVVISIYSEITVLANSEISKVSSIESEFGYTETPSTSTSTFSYHTFPAAEWSGLVSIYSDFSSATASLASAYDAFTSTFTVTDFPVLETNSAMVLIWFVDSNVESSYYDAVSSYESAYSAIASETGTMTRFGGVAIQTAGIGAAALLGGVAALAANLPNTSSQPTPLSSEVLTAKQTITSSQTLTRTPTIIDCIIVNSSVRHI